MIDWTRKWSTRVRTILSGTRAVSNDIVAVRVVLDTTDRVISKFAMYPDGIVADGNELMVETYSMGLVPMFCVVVTAPRLVFAPEGATENNVVVRVDPERTTFADSQT